MCTPSSPKPAPADRVLCVTNRLLCRDDFTARIECIAEARPAGIILREKDLDAPAYRQLAKRLLPICRHADVPLVIHGHPDIARELEVPGLHLTTAQVEASKGIDMAGYTEISASCHSATQAKQAAACGCTRIIAGHVFATDCKKGLPPRGIEFLKSICACTPLPVWAIGGITPSRIEEVCAAGAAGGCMMSAFMLADDPAALIKR